MEHRLVEKGESKRLISATSFLTGLALIPLDRQKVGHGSFDVATDTAGSDSGKLHCRSHE